MSSVKSKAKSVKFESSREKSEWQKIHASNVDSLKKLEREIAGNRIKKLNKDIAELRILDAEIVSGKQKMMGQRKTGINLQAEKERIVPEFAEKGARMEKKEIQERKWDELAHSQTATPESWKRQPDYTKDRKKEKFAYLRQQIQKSKKANWRPTSSTWRQSGNWRTFAVKEESCEDEDTSSVSSGEITPAVYSTVSHEERIRHIVQERNLTSKFAPKKEKKGLFYSFRKLFKKSENVRQCEYEVDHSLEEPRRTPDIFAVFNDPDSMEGLKYHLEKLSENGAEYKALKESIEGANHGLMADVELAEVLRLKRTDLPCSLLQGDQIVMYHGTTQESVVDILLDGFQDRRNIGSRLGPGIYGSVDPSHALSYTDLEDDCNLTAFLFVILTKKDEIKTISGDDYRNHRNNDVPISIDDEEAADNAFNGSHIIQNEALYQSDERIQVENAAHGCMMEFHRKFRIAPPATWSAFREDMFHEVVIPFTKVAEAYLCKVDGRKKSTEEMMLLKKAIRAQGIVYQVDRKAATPSPSSSDSSSPSPSSSAEPLPKRPKLT